MSELAIDSAGTDATPQGSIKLKDLKAAYPKPFSMDTEDGKAWNERLSRANKRHDEQLADVPILSALYSRPYTTINTKDGIVIVKIPWAKAYIDNLVSDIYFKNPDPWIEPRVPSEQSKMVARECRDLAKTLDDDLRTGDHMHQAIVAWGTSGFGGIWENYEQEDHHEQTGYQALDESTGEPQFDNETGEPVPETELVVDDQRVTEDFVRAQDYRFDPDGTDWIGLKDFKWLGRIYTRTLYDMLNDPEYDEPDAKARLIWYAAGYGRFRDGSSASLDVAAKDEQDARYIDIHCFEGWSKVEGQIIHVPLGARFHVTKYAWPRALWAQRRYPTRLISDGFTVRTKEDDNPYPTPLLRHIRALIEDYVRIYDRLLNAATGIVKRYVAFSNTMDRSTFKKWANSDETEIMMIDPEKIRELIGMEDGAATNLFDYLQKLLVLQPGRDTKDEIGAYAAMLDRIERILWETTGQGPADRGGMPISNTATDSANIRAQLDKRTNLGTERIADAYDDLHEIKFLLIGENQTLPIPYRASTATANAEPVWRQFQADMIRGVRLSFRHVVGSSRPPTKAQVKAERGELFAKVMPFWEQIRRDPMALQFLLFVIEPYDATEIEGLLRQMNGLPQAAQEYLQLMLQLKSGKVDPLSPEGVKISARLTELGSLMARGLVSDEQVEQLTSGTERPARTPGNVAASKSPGQQRAASAAAGNTVM